MENVNYLYLKKDDIDTPEYISFIEKQHGVGSFNERRERMLWYWQLGNERYRVFVAKTGCEYVGQASAYKVKVCIKGEEKELWWGVDTFVVSEMRGKGVGGRLQKQLHDDLTGFSSAWYSPANGAIKRKLGSHSILDFPMTYYPLSSYCSILVELALKKTINRNITIPRLRLPFFYTAFNSSRRNWMKEYVIDFFSHTEIPRFSVFMEDCLASEQFHVVRGKEYLRWKYIDNPRMKCQVLALRKNGTMAGLVIFSDVRSSSVVLAKARIVKIYESVFCKDSGLTHRRLIELVANYYKQKGEELDGILSLQKIKYFPKLVYPRPSTELLSTINLGKLSSGYITYSDQDME